MNTATTTTIAIVTIMSALVFVVAGSYFAVMNAFAQRNSIPSPNSQAYYNACVYQQPKGTHAAFCYPP